MSSILNANFFILNMAIFVTYCTLIDGIAFFHFKPQEPAKVNHKLPEIIGNKFMYFAYGSNLLKKRIHLQNKSAVHRGIGKLENHELVFYTYSDRWKGAPATIVPKPGTDVWGAIYEIDLSNMDDLDKQEEVDKGIYEPLSVPINRPNGGVIMCRAYKLIKDPEPLKSKDIPFDRQPSHTYLETIIKGAEESGLPSRYINYLKTFKDNGQVSKEMVLKLGF